MRYDHLNAMLLNEFLKAHQQMEEQQAMIDQLKKQIETLAAHSKEQDSKMQRVTARFDLNEAVTQLAANKP